jgi:transposase
MPMLLSFVLVDGEKVHSGMGFFFSKPDSLIYNLPGTDLYHLSLGFGINKRGMWYDRAMRPKLKITGPGTLAEVRKAFDRETDVKRKARLHVVRLGFVGEYSSGEIAAVVGCSKGSVTNWVRAYRLGGLEQLLKTNYRSGRAPSLDEAACAELLEGLRLGRWKRMKEIRKWLLDAHQVRLSNGGMQYWLGKLGASLKVPRKSHAKKR